MIRYRYASCGGAVVDIDQVDERMRAACSFVCFSCGGAMVARLGEVNQRHFAHQSLGECSGETYLHRVAKRLFVERYAQGGVGLRYPVERVCSCHQALLGVPCVVGSEWREFDLTERFSTVLEEQRDGQLIPDVCLVDGRGEKIYVEVAVTHRCSPEKIASGVRIIEFLIETEADLALLRRDCYTLGDEDRVRFYNFLPPRIEERQEGCTRTFWAFEAFASGKYRLGSFLAAELNRSAVYRKIYSEQVSLGVAVAQAEQQGVVVRHCGGCVHADRHRRVVRGGVWCRFLGGAQWAVCAHYRQL